MTTQNNPHKFTLGQRVRCIVTGFEGIATTRVEWLNGCVQYLVKPRANEKDGEPWKMPDGSYLDDQQLVLVDEGILDGHLQPPRGARDLLDEPDAPAAATGGPSHREGELPT